jgi:hypothetical protein
MSKLEIHGTVADGFEAVREEFAAAVAAEDGESGAQLAAYAGGRKVVDMWAGDGVTGDTLTGVYSSTKGAATPAAASPSTGPIPNTTGWPPRSTPRPPPPKNLLAKGVAGVVSPGRVAGGSRPGVSPLLVGGLLVAGRCLAVL